MYERIVVLLDETARGEQALGWVRYLAGGSDSVVHLLCVCPAAAMVQAGGRVVAFADQLEDAARARVLSYLEPIAAVLREDGRRVVTHIQFGAARAAIATAVAQLSADLVVTSAGHVGAVRRVLRHTAVPVLAIGLGCRRSA